MPIEYYEKGLNGLTGQSAFTIVAQSTRRRVPRWKPNMNPRWIFRPNLLDCLLEERVAPAIANFGVIILTTTGYSLLIPFPGANSTGSVSGAGGQSVATSAQSVSGTAQPTSFYITGTNGISSLRPGNITGVPSLAGGGTLSGGASITIQVGSGAIPRTVPHRRTLFHATRWPTQRRGRISPKSARLPTVPAHRCCRRVKATGITLRCLRRRRMGYCRPRNPHPVPACKATPSHQPHEWHSDTWPGQRHESSWWRGTWYRRTDATRHKLIETHSAARGFDQPTAGNDVQRSVGIENAPSGNALGAWHSRSKRVAIRSHRRGNPLLTLGR